MEKIPDSRNDAVLSICLTEHSKTALCPCIRSLQQKDILIPHRLQCCNRVREKKLSTKLHLCSCSLSFDFCFVFFLGRRTFFSDLGAIFPLKLWKDLGAPKLAIPGLSCKQCVRKHATILQTFWFITTLLIQLRQLKLSNFQKKNNNKPLVFSPSWNV